MIDRKKLTDSELLERYSNGDHASLECIINKYKDRIYTYILVNIKQQHLAEDIFQETFIKVINSLHHGKYADNGRFVSWVMRIAHNLIIDHYRRERNVNICSKDAYDQELILNSKNLSDDTIEDLIITDQIHADVKTLINELPEDQKEVVILRHYLDMSFKDIAEKTGVSINTALGRMRYALINIRRIAEEKGVVLTMD